MPVQEIAIAPKASPGWLRPGLRIYAIGDLHGRLDLLDTLIEKITQDRAERPVPLSCEVYLGDYIDRGADSAGVIERLSVRARTFPLYRLAGNHEAMLLAALEDPARVGRWLTAGGAAAALSYGVSPPPADAGPEENEAFRQALVSALPPHHLDFLRQLRFSLHIDGYFFAHAGVRPKVPLAEQSAHDLMWIRAEFLNADDDHGAIVVHGHTPVATPDIRENRIGIDTGAFATGRLTCLVLEVNQLRFLASA